jgi:hypothetical protein
MARGEVNGQKNNPKRACEGKEMAPGIDRRGALKARMRLCLILRQGASPLRPPAPFPSGSRFQNGGDLSRVRKPRNNGAPLTAPLRSEDIAEMRERGLLARAGESSIYAKGTALYARMRRCLNTPSGGKPPETPLPLVNYFLDSGGPSHGSRDREKLRTNGSDRATHSDRACKRRRMGVDIVQAYAAKNSTERTAGTAKAWPTCRAISECGGTES